MMEIRGDLCHELLVKTMAKKLAFCPTEDYETWREKVKEKLCELLGMAEIEKNACPLQLTIESEVQKEGYKQIRFVFESEKGAVVPCYLLIPDTRKEKYPVAITLQGHSSGFHNSIAEPKNEKEIDYATGRGAFAVQAVKNGFAALAIEQRAMGERTTERHVKGTCNYLAMSAIILGRTLIGERAWDVMRAIDVLSYFKELDLEKIVITGNSGGGTTSFYSACLDERIKISAPSCSFCTYDSSILDIHHCPCNQIPYARQWFDMGELSCLIAPRKFIVIAGKEDDIFPLSGVEKAFSTVKDIYQAAGATGNCRMEITPKGHWWCEDVVWNAIKEEMKNLGW